MSYFRTFLFAIALLGFGQVQAFSLPDNFHTQSTPLVLESLPDLGTKVAGVYWLPDYLDKNLDFTNRSQGGDNKPQMVAGNCAAFNNDGSGRTYVESTDFNLYQCSGPRSMANKVKCYYDCKCKPAVAFDANSETCAYKCNGVCVGGVSCKPAVYPGTGEHCTLKCRGNTSICVTKACNAAVSVGTGEYCSQRCASNSNVCTAKACNAAVSVGTGESCTQRCASNSNVCTGKACNSAVSVGTGEYCSQRCASNSNICTGKACNAAVSVGTGEYCSQRCASNSNVCTAKACNSAVSVGTGEYCSQRCASNSNVCTAKACNSAVSVGTGEYCSQRCASNSNVCTTKACNAAVSVGSGETCTQRCASNNAVCTAKGCASGYTSSGGACVCATSCAHKVTSKPENSYYTTTSCSACGVTSSIQTGWECNSGYNKSGNSCVAACTPKGNETGCSYGTETCSDGCGGTRICCKGCTPKTAATGCSYGTETCSDGCGGTTTCCKSCTPAADETNCAHGTESCSNGCGGTRICCTAIKRYSLQIWEHFTTQSDSKERCAGGPYADVSIKAPGEEYYTNAGQGECRENCRVGNQLFRCRVWDLGVVEGTAVRVFNYTTNTTVKMLVNSVDVQSSYYEGVVDKNTAIQIYLKVN